MSAPLTRRYQRDKGATHVPGLLLGRRPNSMPPMVEQWGVGYQGLQQVVSSSKWAVQPVCERLARRAVEVIAPKAWVVDDTGFIKDGNAWPGVARQYSGTLGKVGNCQIGVSVSAVTDAASCPLSWQLFLPESWDDDAATTPEAAAVIRAAGPRRHSRQHPASCEMAAGAGDARRAGRLGAAPAGEGRRRRLQQQRRLPRRHHRARQLLRGRRRRGPDRVRRGRGAAAAAVLRPGPPASAALPHPPGRPARSRARRRPARHRVGHLAGRLPRGVDLNLLALRVRPAGRNPTARLAADGSLPLAWLLAEWPAEAAEPTDYRLSDLPEDTPLAELVRLAEIRWRIEHDFRELRTDLGLDHFKAASGQAGIGTSLRSPPPSGS
ncbi:MULTISPECIES: IS701 family transposase [unclassified Geodermatophilus]